MSPMYDVDAAIRQFPDLKNVTVLSIENECKEVILDFEINKYFENYLNPTPTIEAKMILNNQFLICQKTEKILEYTSDTFVDPDAIGVGVKYIIEPDVAFYKARMLPSFYDHILKNDDTNLTASNGFFLSKTKKSEQMPARVFKILDVFEYQPKKINQNLKSLNINALNVVQRNFPFSTQQIRTALKVKEGGDFFLICTLVKDKKMAWLAERLTN